MARALQDLVKECGIQEAWLGREVAPEHYYEISGYLSQWRQLAITRFNIPEGTVENIESDNRTAEERKVSFLRTLKQRMSMQATFRALIEALLSIGRTDDARGVCQILTGMPLTCYMWNCVSWNSEVAYVNFVTGWSKASYLVQVFLKPFRRGAKNFR